MLYHGSPGLDDVALGRHVEVDSLIGVLVSLDLPAVGESGVPGLPTDQRVAGRQVLPAGRGLGLLLDAPVSDDCGLLLHRVDLLGGVDPALGHVLHHGLPGLEELVVRGEELVVDPVTVPLLAPPLVRPDLPSGGQTLVSWRREC